MNSDSDIAPVLHPRTHTHTAKQTGTKGMQVTAVALRALGPLVGEIPPAARRRRIPAALAVGRHGATAQREPPRPPRPATLAASFPASPSRPLHPPTASATPSAVASATQPQPSSRACADCGMRFFFFWWGGGGGWGWGGVVPLYVDPPCTRGRPLHSSRRTERSGRAEECAVLAARAHV